MRRRRRIKTGIEIGDPDAPEIYGRPGIHEPSHGHVDAPLSARGRVIFYSIVAVVAAAAVLLFWFSR